MNRNRYAVLFNLLLCLVTGTRLSAINVTETTDFSANTNVSIGTLDPGANTVSGSLAGICNIGDCNPHPDSGPNTDTQDSLTLTVPNGYQITSLTVTSSITTSPANFSLSMELDLASGGFVTSTPFLSPLNGTTGNLLSSPVGANEYRLSIYGQQATAAGAYSLNWSVTMNLAPLVVFPQDAVRNLINLIADPFSGLVLTNGQTSSLTDKLNNALTSILAGQNKQGINQLNAFINSVASALKTGKMSVQTANTLTIAANAIITSLQ